MPAPDAVLRAIDSGFERTLDELIELSRIPGVSAAGFDARQVERSAEAVASLLAEAGLQDVEILRIPGAHPYVVAEWNGAGEAAPRVLLYAHHDVQPPGRIDRWDSPPFEPTLRGDGRLYGRGVVDDKAGALVHLAALRAWLEVEGTLPVNVKVLVEGEEETGSGHLAEFLGQYRERLDADVIVLSDTANLATGLPSLTTSLRGLVIAEVHVRALDHPLHSGMWGGVVPDAATALASILGRLTDDQGNPAIPGLADDVPPLDDAERLRLASLPFDEAEFRRDAGLLDGVRVAGVSDRSVYERLWVRPSIAVTALEAAPLAEAANQLISESAAKVGVRLAPGQDAERVRDLLVAWLEKDPPSGVEVDVRCEAASPGWQTEPVGPAFDAARRALAAGFGRAPVFIGCGGTIPFVGPFAEQLGDVPALLLGLEDPVCNAHGENESLDLDDFRKSIYSLAHLFSELSEVRFQP
ncbi:MAG: M20/M25/M40 family metallo-hydrolase [Myxococcota bacterium]|nr:M20/M25/M40 family metallo-hydrolase [Myxococcota bacterium]